MPAARIDAISASSFRPRLIYDLDPGVRAPLRRYPYLVRGVPILQQFYGSKYAGVTTLEFAASGALASVAAADSVPLGTWFDDTRGLKMRGGARSRAPSC